MVFFYEVDYNDQLDVLLVASVRSKDHITFDDAPKI